jgi:hypothetical protein
MCAPTSLLIGPVELIGVGAQEGTGHHEIGVNEHNHLPSRRQHPRVPRLPRPPVYYLHPTIDKETLNGGLRGQSPRWAAGGNIEMETLKGGLRCYSPRWAAGVTGLPRPTPPKISFS